jgi:pyroglutamyl-peptidase
MRAPRETVLLTGFGPFPGVSDNASARLVETLAVEARRKFPRVAFHAEVLSTEWTAAPERLDAVVASIRPNLMLHFGVARDCPGFRIETRAQNACHVIDDAAGLKPADAWLVENGAPSRSATLPSARIVARLTSLGFPAHLSDDAGGYLCNAVLYFALSYAATACQPCSAGFIHIPADLSGPTLTFDDAVTGSLEILRLCLEKPDVNI